MLQPCPGQVDPDVETVRNFFKLDKFAWEHMSPVVFPPGFTRKVIDGRVQTGDLLHKIKDSFTALATNSDFTLLEGSGLPAAVALFCHTAVVRFCHLRRSLLPYL